MEDSFQSALLFPIAPAFITHIKPCASAFLDGVFALAMEFCRLFFIFFVFQVYLLMALSILLVFFKALASYMRWVYSNDCLPHHGGACYMFTYRTHLLIAVIV